MNLPLYDNSVASGLLAGILFGFVLENAGFASARKLTGQFRLTDWSVFKVMFTAVLVSAVGLWLLQALGVFGFADVYVPTTYFYAMGLGGVLIGAGFAIGGYCPGTSAVGLATGRGDALVFMLGMVAGSIAFGVVYPVIEPLYRAGQGPEGQQLGDLLGLPNWVILLALIAVAAGGFQLGSGLEKRFAGQSRPTDPSDGPAGAPSAAE